MYDESKINWKKILKNGAIIIGVILVILGIIALITKCSRNDDKPEEKEVSLKGQLDVMEDAVIKFLSVDILPTQINASKTFKLSTLEGKGLVTNLKDSENNVCDSNSSYAEVIKLNNNYAVKMTLTCGSNREDRIFYVGCFNTCEGGICKGSEFSTGGICNSTPTPEPEKPSGNNTTQTKPVNTKPNTNSNTENNNTENNNNNNNSNTASINLVTLYEFQRSYTKFVCTSGEYDKNTKACMGAVTRTLTGKIKTIPGSSKIVGSPTVTSKTEPNTVFFRYSTDSKKSTSINKNTATVVTYKFATYDPSQGYGYKKKTMTYKCASGNISKDLKSCIMTTASKITCEDSSYTYNKNNNTCTKVVTERGVLPNKPISRTYTEYKWSKNTKLDGWIRTTREPKTVIE